jgi:MFS superfamily sulfate permease-like transporter
VTFALVVMTDLLTGVLVGIALSLVELIPHRNSLRLKVETDQSHEASHIRLNGAATFVSLNRLTRALERIPANHDVHLDLREMKGIDHTTEEMVRDWLARRRTGGRQVEVEATQPVLARLAGAH